MTGKQSGSNTSVKLPRGRHPGLRGEVTRPLAVREGVDVSLPRPVLADRTIFWIARGLCAWP